MSDPTPDTPRPPQRRSPPRSCTHAPHRTCLDCAVGVFRARPATAGDVALLRGDLDD